MTQVYIECESAFLNTESIENIENMIKSAAEYALSYLNTTGEISVTVVSNDEIHELNLLHRGIDRPTDVLSFPANEGEEILALPDGFLGDIIISAQKACEQACEYGHSVLREIAFLTLHGTLHLLGYDHMNEEDEKEMFALQRAILDDMGVKR